MNGVEGSGDREDRQGHLGLSAVEKADLWPRFKHEQSLSKIGPAHDNASVKRSPEYDDTLPYQSCSVVSPMVLPRVSLSLGQRL